MTQKIPPVKSLLCGAFLSVWLWNASGGSALAQGSSKSQYDPDPAFSTGAGYAPDNGQIGGQNLTAPSGDMFMEEVIPDNAKPKPKPKPIPIDLSRVGVSVDPHGQIVPTLTDQSAPWAQSGVKPFYNNIETSTTMPYVVPNYYPYGGIPAYGAPFTGYGIGYPPVGFPGYSSYPGYGYQGYGYPGYAFPGYAPGYAPGNQGSGWRGMIPAMIGGALNTFNAYNGLPPAYSPYFGFANPYNPYVNPYLNNGGYSPFNLGGMPYSYGLATTGNSATFLSNDPVTGAPLAPGPQGNSQSNFSTGGGTFSPAPWLPSTSYSGSSMWKAFNLAF